MSTTSEWDAVAYDRISAPQTRWGLSVLDRLHLEGAETVLDAGCGSGRVTEALLLRHPRVRVIALDGSRAMLDRAKERLAGFGGRVRFVRCDLLELTPAVLREGFDAGGGSGLGRGGVEAGGVDRGGVVDAVVSTATFHWVTDHDQLFENLGGVLVPGGRLVAQCGASGNLDALLAVVRGFGAERRGTWQYASPEVTSARLARAGFVDVAVWTNPEPTEFATPADLVEFLEKVVLRDHVAAMPPNERRAFVTRVAASLPSPVLDYVRLNITAVRSPSAPGPSSPASPSSSAPPSSEGE